MLGIHRHIRTTGGDDRVHRHHQIHRAPQRQPDQRLGAHALGNQQPRKTIDATGELRIGQFSALERHRDPIRIRPDRSGELIQQQPRIDRPAGRVPAVQHQFAFRRVEQLDITDGGRRIGDDPVQHPYQPVRDPPHIGLVEHVLPIPGPDPQGSAECGDEGERVVRGVDTVEAGHRHSVDIGGSRLDAFGIHRIRLEHQQGVEQRRHPGRGVDIGKAHIVVIQQIGLFDLDPGQHCPHGFVSIEPHPHRDRVDEQPDHGLHTGQLRRTAGDRGAEQHIVATGQTSQQYRPRHLQHRVRRHADLGGQRGHPGGGRGVQLELVLTRQRVDFGCGAARFGADEQCRFLDLRQRRPPGLQRDLAILPAHPCQEGPIGMGRRQRTGIGTDRVQRQQIPHEQRHGPAVEQNVMVRHHELPGIRPGRDQGEPEQRRLGEIEAPQPVRFDEVGGRPGAAAVVLGPVDRHILQDHLNRVALVVGDEGGTQVLVPIDQGLCRRTQPGGIHPAGQRQHHLRGVDIHGLRGQLRVEPHPGLHRGQRPHIGDRHRESPLDSLDIGLRQCDQTEIG